MKDVSSDRRKWSELSEQGVHKTQAKCRGGQTSGQVCQKARCFICLYVHPLAKDPSIRSTASHSYQSSSTSAATLTETRRRRPLHHPADLPVGQ